MNRFENAAVKLYNAFNNGTLDQNKCTACAVGNLLGHGFWTGSSNTNTKSIEGVRIVKPQSRELIRMHMDLITHKDHGIKETVDYTIEELSKIEQTFLDSFVGLNYKEEKSKDNQYNALMAVLEYLAELDNIEVPSVTIDDFKRVLENA
jgi:hypothetical protein